MTSHYLATRFALLALLGSHLEQVQQKCPAIAVKPQPRTDEATRVLQDQLAFEVQQKDEAEGADVIFYGDSITEAWRGTDMGWPCERCTLGPEVFRQSFGSKYKNLVMAVGAQVIAGDQVTQVHWRIMNSNAPVRNQPQVAVVNSGINDLLLGNGCYPMDALGNITAFRILDMVESLLEALPRTHVVLVSILPAGDPEQPEKLFHWPNALTAGIETANHWLNTAYQEHEHVTFLDCNHKFIPFGWIEHILQADGLHPTHYGLKVLADCISPVVDEILMHGHRQGVSHHVDRRLHHNLSHHVPNNQLPSFTGD